jgi:hypothetical protein
MKIGNSFELFVGFLNIEFDPEYITMDDCEANNNAAKWVFLIRLSLCEIFAL